MASVSNHNGNRLIQFTDGQGIRRTIRLGKCNAKDASTICGHIGAMLAAKLSGQPVAAPTAAWIGALGETPYGDTLHNRLAAVGLVEPRAKQAAITISRFTEQFIAGLVDAKPQTAVNLGQTRRVLLEFFGDCPMQSVTPEKVTDFQKHLMGRFAEATYRRHLGRGRQLWRAAAKRKLFAGENPFSEVSTSVRGNRERRQFIPRATIEKCIAAAPDAQWRLIIALSRYGGLRTPSETLALTWDCINWEHNRIRVPSPKTEHHKGGDCRIIPMFPELKQRLLDVFDEAEPGEPWVITRYRHASVNLRTTFLKIIHRAGEKPWPKLFHNLRASRATELCEAYPAHVVADWLGHSEAIAQEHYLSTTDAHFERAVAEPESKPENGPCSALQKALQYDAVLPSIASHAENDDMQKPQCLLGNADTCESMQNVSMPGTGFEPARACAHQHLKLARLPISPPGL